MPSFGIPTTPNKYRPLTTTTTTTPLLPAPRGPRGRGMRIRNRNTRLLLDEGSSAVHFLAGLLEPSPNQIPSPESPPDNLIRLESGEEESRTSSSSSSSSSLFNSGNFHLFTPTNSSSSNVSSGSNSVTDTSTSDPIEPDKCDPRLCKLNLIEQ